MAFAETKTFGPPPLPNIIPRYFRYIEPISNEFVMKTDVIIKDFGRI